MKQQELGTKHSTGYMDTNTQNTQEHTLQSRTPTSTNVILRQEDSLNCNSLSSHNSYWVSAFSQQYLCFWGSHKNPRTSSQIYVYIHILYMSPFSLVGFLPNLVMDSSYPSDSSQITCPTIERESYCVLSPRYMKPAEHTFQTAVHTTSGGSVTQEITIHPPPHHSMSSEVPMTG